MCLSLTSVVNVFVLLSCFFLIFLRSKSQYHISARRASSPGDVRRGSPGNLLFLLLKRLTGWKRTINGGDGAKASGLTGEKPPFFSPISTLRRRSQEGRRDESTVVSYFAGPLWGNLSILGLPRRASSLPFCPFLGRAILPVVIDLRLPEQERGPSFTFVSSPRNDGPHFHTSKPESCNVMKKRQEERSTEIGSRSLA